MSEWPEWEELDLSDLYYHVDRMQKTLLRSVGREARLTEISLILREVYTGILSRNAPKVVTRLIHLRTRLMLYIAQNWARGIVLRLPVFEATAMSGIFSGDVERAEDQAGELMDIVARELHRQRVYKQEVESQMPLAEQALRVKLARMISWRERGG